MLSLSELLELIGRKKLDHWCYFEDTLEKCMISKSISNEKIKKLELRHLENIKKNNRRI